MALITCPECQKQVSDKAPACIHCGAPLGAGALVGSAGPAGSTAPTAAAERVVWEGRPSHYTAFFFYLVTGLLFWLVVPLVMLIHRYLVIRCTRYTLTNQRLTIRTGILSRSTEEIELFRVVDTGLDEPLILRLFGLGNVLVVPHDATAATVVLAGVAHAETVRNHVRDHTTGARTRRGVVAMDAI